MLRPIWLFLLPLLAACGDTGEPPTTSGTAADCSGIDDPQMVWIEGGSFTMGESPRYTEEGPPREVKVEGFWISQTEVTNAQFARFVAETGYVTTAEQAPPTLPGAPPEMLQPGSAVFRVPTQENRNWWHWVAGAQWRNPAGPGSSIDGLDNDPVVHVTLEDARAYAEWAGLVLPSEEQWEYAARAGGPAKPQPVDASGRPLANYYQGAFPARDLGEDGFTSRAPVGCFAANAFGLHDMIGNVWEWTESADDSSPTAIVKGGSYLCADNYCARYRSAARQYQELDLGTNHIGFRVVRLGNSQN